MSKVLLTGATGFVAVHVLKELLSKGYAVRATVRSEAKSVYLKNKFATDKLSFVTVPDIAVAGAFDTAVKDMDYIIHTASPFQNVVQDNLKDLLNPAIEGTRGILESAKKYAPTVKQVVILSSFAAVFNPPLTLNGRPTFTEKDWNSLTLEEAISADNETAYRASKKLAEQAAWDFLEQEKPDFAITVFNPPYIWGPMEHDVSISTLNTSNAIVYYFVKNHINPDPSLIFGFVDVRDLATALVLALGNPKAQNERFLISGGLYNFDAILSIIKRYLAEGEAYAQGPDDSAEVCAVATASSGGISTTKVVGALGVTFRSLKTCFVDLIRQLLELEKATK